MAARSYVELVLPVLDGLSDSTLLRTLVAQVSTAVLTYSAPEHREQLRQQVVTHLAALAQRAAAGSDAQLQLVTAVADLTAPGDDTSWIAGLLDGSEVAEGLAVDTDAGLVYVSDLGGSIRSVEIGRDHAVREIVHLPDSSFTGIAGL